MPVSFLTQFFIRPTLYPHQHGIDERSTYGHFYNAYIKIDLLEISASLHLFSFEFLSLIALRILPYWLPI